MLKESCGNGGKLCPKFCTLALKLNWMWVQYLNDGRSNRRRDLNVNRQKKGKKCIGGLWCGVSDGVPGTCLEDVV